MVFAPQDQFIQSRPALRRCAETAEALTGCCRKKAVRPETAPKTLCSCAFVSVRLDLVRFLNLQGQAAALHTACR